VNKFPDSKITAEYENIVSKIVKSID